MSKTVIITGAHGFIGRHTARVASGRGYRVIGIGHGQWLPDEWRPWGLNAWHDSDVSIESLRKCAEDPYAILHLAGGASVPVSIARPLEDFQRTVQTTANVLEYIRTQSPNTRVVYCSSAGIYGLVKAVPIVEMSQPNPMSPYGAHKYMAEQLMSYYARHFHIATSIVRCFSVYGCGLRKQLLWDACRKLSAGDSVFMGTGLEVRDWLHVEDVVNLLLLAVDNSGPECSIVNGGSGQGVSVGEIVRELSANLTVKEEVTFSGAKRAGDPSHLVADIRKAVSWGWQPQRDWREGVAEYASWWLQEDQITKALLTRESDTSLSNR